LASLTDPINQQFNTTKIQRSLIRENNSSYLDHIDRTVREANSRSEVRFIVSGVEGEGRVEACCQRLNGAEITGDSVTEIRLSERHFKGWTGETEI
jgi:hypothetical protein